MLNEIPIPKPASVQLTKVIASGQLGSSAVAAPAMPIAIRSAPPSRIRGHPRPPGPSERADRQYDPGERRRQAAHDLEGQRKEGQRTEVGEGQQPAQAEDRGYSAAKAQRPGRQRAVEYRHRERAAGRHESQRHRDRVLLQPGKKACDADSEAQRPPNCARTARRDALGIDTRERLED
jgi:hypothetical protein